MQEVALNKLNVFIRRSCEISALILLRERGKNVQSINLLKMRISPIYSLKQHETFFRDQLFETKKLSSKQSFHAPFVFVILFGKPSLFIAPQYATSRGA